jgi:hypothetical protein
VRSKAVLLSQRVEVEFWPRRKASCRGSLLGMALDRGSNYARSGGYAQYLNDLPMGKEGAIRCAVGRPR